ncbi:MAG: phosphate/phosphite/phosphonate ABC transporter substrate-binding protein [Actinomycetota bacterium]
MRTTPWRLLFALLAAMSLVAAACGDSDDDADDAVGAATEAAEDAADEADDNVSDAADAAGEAVEETEDAAADAAEAVEGAADAEDREGWPSELRFAVVPSQEEQQQIDRYQPVLDILEEELGIPIEFSFATDYAGVIEAMIAGNLDMAQFGPFSYVIATGNGADIVPIAIGQEGDNPASYRSYGVTQAGNEEINSLADYADRNICFVDPGSTSGFLFPSAGLLGEGIDPETGVSGTFAGGHDASALSVANGTCEAGFAFDAMVTALLPEQGDITGVIDTVEDETFNEGEAQLKIVWKSPPIPNSPVAIQAGFPQSFIDAVTDVYVNELNADRFLAEGFCTQAEYDEGTCSIAEEGATQYLPVTDELYDGIRFVCEQTGSARCEG